MNITDELVEGRPEATPRRTPLAIAAAISLLAVWSLSSPSKWVPLCVFAVIALGVIAWAFSRATREHYRVLMALALIEVIIQTRYISHDLRAIGHYGLVALFCFPLLPKVWCDRTRWRGGFKLYACYLGWAAVTIVYSLAPTYSAARLFDAVVVLSVLTLLAGEIEDREGAERLIAQLTIAFSVTMAFVAATLVLLPRSLTWSLPDMTQPGSAMLRFSSILGNPNDVGELMLLTVGCCMCSWPRVSRKWKFAIVLIIPAALLADALADSRTPFIALMVGATAWAIWKYRARGILIIAGTGLLMVLAFLAFGNWHYLERGNVTTLTGRTEIWSYIIKRIEARPLLGYGYEVGGAIYQRPYFPLWWGPWSQGPHSSLHDGYFDRAIGVGVPATLFWLYIVLRPWVSLFRSRTDDWGLKPVAFWIVLPSLVHNLAESSVSDGVGAVGLAFVAVWAIAERYRLFKLEQEQAERREKQSRLSPAIAALSGALALFLCLALLPRKASAAGLGRMPNVLARGSYFSTLPPHSPLPSGAKCAAEVRAAGNDSGPDDDPRPGNYAANHTIPTVPQLAAFHLRPVKGTFAPVADFERVSGDFTGTTDQILRWAACKWGIDENVVRAEAAAESHWYQDAAGDLTTDRLLCPPGSGFIGAWNGSTCKQSYGIMQVKFRSFGGWPLPKDSTAFNVDFRLSYQRACMNGDINYLSRRIPPPGYPLYPDGTTDQMLWGCMGDWYSGSWFSPGALRYIASVKALLVQEPWLKSGFRNAR
jgi:O-antigen ligase